MIECNPAQLGSAFFSVVPNATECYIFRARTDENGTESYRCEKCDYATSKVGNWKRHLKTKKHNATQMLQNATYLGAKTSRGSQPTGSKSCFA